MDAATREEMLDILFDLKHDLGKYVRLPLAMLPAGASDKEVVEAVRHALFATRTGPAGTRPARAIWDDFVAEAKGTLEVRTGWPRLQSSVAAALAWETRVHDRATAVSRTEVERDLASVSESIQALIEELLNG